MSVYRKYATHYHFSHSYLLYTSWLASYCRNRIGHSGVLVYGYYGLYLWGYIQVSSWPLQALNKLNFSRVLDSLDFPNENYECKPEQIV